MYINTLIERIIMGFIALISVTTDLKICARTLGSGAFWILCARNIFFLYGCLPESWYFCCYRLATVILDVRKPTKAGWSPYVTLLLVKWCFTLFSDKWTRRHLSVGRSQPHGQLRLETIIVIYFSDFKLLGEQKHVGSIPRSRVLRRAPLN